MSHKTFLIGIASFGILLGINSGQVAAQMTHHESNTNTKINNQFQRVEQPLWIKGVVTVGGLGLIGLDLWWFLWSQRSSQKTTTKNET